MNSDTSTSQNRAALNALTIEDLRGAAALAEQPGDSFESLAAATGLARTPLKKSLAKLVKAGVVHRVRRPNRGVVYHLTLRGYAWCAAYRTSSRVEDEEEADVN